MQTKDAIRFLLKSNRDMVAMYLADMSDADLLVRAVPSANHTAWQLGHLISSEANFFIPKLPGMKSPELPKGFAEQHSKETSTQDSPQGFKTKSEYLALHQKVREATLSALDKLSDADLDKPSGWNDMAPTIGSLFIVIANHDMMHAGQFTVVRRKLGKPVLF